MFGGTTNTFVDGDFWKYLKNIRFLLPAAILLCTPFARWISGKIRKPVVRDIGRGVAVLAIFVLSVLSIVTELYNPFIYFNF